MRVKNYIKNFLIGVPFIFSGDFFNIDCSYIELLLGFIAFCLITSVVYIINDIVDIEKDKLHPTKCKRPIASKQITEKRGLIIAIILGLTAIVSLILLGNIVALALLLLYLMLNIIYSLILKKYPIIDIAVLSLFFIIRIYYGAALVDVEVSSYLYLTVMSVALMMGTDKRKNEKKYSAECRESLELYTHDCLTKLAYSFMVMSIIFYSLWVLSDVNIFLNNDIMLISIFFVTIILTYYQYIIEQREEGNPVDIVLVNPLLLCLIFMYSILIICGFIFR